MKRAAGQPKCGSTDREFFKALRLTLLYLVLLAMAYAPPILAQEIAPFEQALQTAVSQNKPVLVLFHSDRSPASNAILDRMAAAELTELRKGFVFVSLDANQEIQLATRLGVRVVPTLIVVDPLGNALSELAGLPEVDALVEWLEKHVELPKSKSSNSLLDGSAPTRTECLDLIDFLGDRQPIVRAIALERLVQSPKSASNPVIANLSEKPLAVRIGLVEILDRWNAPIDDLDPWESKTITPAVIEQLGKWREANLDRFATELPVPGELSDAELTVVAGELDRFVTGQDELSAGLSRLIRYGTRLLPVIYQRLQSELSDQEAFRLTAARYFLVASNERRLNWLRLTDLARLESEVRRGAVKELMESATGNDESLLLELFSDPDPLIREMSLKGISQVGTKKANESLARLLDDPDPNVRAAVLKQFTESPPSSLVAKIADYLDTEQDTDLIVHALGCLKATTNRKAIAAILKLVNHEAWQVRARVAEILSEVEAESVSVETSAEIGRTVMRLLNDDDGFVVSRAVGALPQSRDRETLDRLATALKRHPEIAEPVFEALGLESSYASSRSNHAKLIPFFESLMAEPDARIRAMAIKGMGRVNEKKLTGQFVGLLDDPAREVQLAVLETMITMLRELKEGVHDKVRSAFEDPELYDEFAESDMEPSVWGGILSIFGGTGRRPRSRLADSDDAFELVPDVNELVDDPLLGEPLAEFEEPADATDSQPVKQYALQRAEWLEQWYNESKDKPEWLGECRPILKRLASGQDDAVSLSAMQLLVISGENDSFLEQLSLRIANEPGAWNAGVEIISWLPVEERLRLFNRMLAIEGNGTAEMDSLLAAFTGVRHPRVIDTLWEVLETGRFSPVTFQSAAKQAYLGATHVNYGSGESELPRDFVKQHVEDIQNRMSEQSELRQGLGLALLSELDTPSARESAQSLLESSQSERVRELALRILLTSKDLPTKGSRKEQQEFDVIKYLDGTNDRMASLVLQFLANPSSLSGYRESNDWFHVGWNLTIQLNVSGFDEGTNTAAKPPRGLKLDHIRPFLKSPDLQTRASAEYFQVLLGEKNELKSLIAWSRGGGADQEIDKLLYRAIAALDDETLVPELTRIYEQHKESQWYCRELYWSIRLIKGSHASALRKRMRDEIGMQNLR